MEGRLRFALEVIKSVRDEVGEDYPVFIKLNGSDNLEEGFCLKGAAFAARAMDEVGIDLFEISGGTPASGDKSPARTKIDTLEKECYHLDLAEEIKRAVSAPVMLVGGVRSFELAEKLIADERVDYISMSRPFIREPALANRWKAGDTSRATCISCNGCFKTGMEEGGIYCVVDKKDK
jgi:2,4-dienoyl-CoA reductase-like NADH-dependent reductase (Old Yellow Enzyme family)